MTSTPSTPDPSPGHGTPAVVSTDSPARLVETWPVLAGQMRDSLVTAGETALARQVETLTVHGRCVCTDEFCQSVLTAPAPDGAYGDGYRCVSLTPPWPGMLILDVVHEQIVYVEILHRDPLD